MPLHPEDCQLTLWVQPNSCLCGNKWTNSYVTYKNGGTPTPSDLHSLPLTFLIERYNHLHNHCFRCISLSLNIGWSKPGPLLSAEVGGPVANAPLQDYTPRSRPSSRSVAHKNSKTSLSDLEKEIFDD